jgi:hypothetical protein
MQSERIEDFSAWELAEDWLEKPATKRVFPTLDAWEWWKRPHKRRFVELGMLISRGGQAKDLVQPAKLEPEVLRLMREQTASRN